MLKSNSFKFVLLTLAQINQQIICLLEDDFAFSFGVLVARTIEADFTYGETWSKRLLQIWHELNPYIRSV